MTEQTAKLEEKLNKAYDNYYICMNFKAEARQAMNEAEEEYWERKADAFMTRIKSIKSSIREQQEVEA